MNLYTEAPPERSKVEVRMIALEQAVRTAQITGTFSDPREVVGYAQTYLDFIYGGEKKETDNG